MKSGIYIMDADEYHADPCEGPSLSSSLIRTIIQKSLYHAWLGHPKLNLNFESDNDEKFDIGTAAHALILEGKDDSISVIEFDSYRTNDSKAARDAALLAGKLPVLSHQYESVLQMQKAFDDFIKGTEFNGFQTIGNPEQTLIWENGDIEKRARLDFLFNDYSIIIDYKTTTNANPIQFIAKKIPQLQYDVQGAFYCQGVHELTGVYPTYIWIIQENEPPYACSMVGLGPEMQEKADVKIKFATAIWKDALKLNYWPRYPAAVLWADPVVWDEYAFNDRKSMEADNEL